MSERDDVPDFHLYLNSPMYSTPLDCYVIFTRGAQGFGPSCWSFAILAAIPKVRKDALVIRHDNGLVSSDSFAALGNLGRQDG